MPRPRAHAPSKQGGKPAGQDTSGYNDFEKRYVSKLVRARERNSGMNVIEIIDGYFQTIWTLGPDHENIIDIPPSCVRLP